MTNQSQASGPLRTFIERRAFAVNVGLILIRSSRDFDTFESIEKTVKGFKRTLLVQITSRKLERKRSKNTEEACNPRSLDHLPPLNQTTVQTPCCDRPPTPVSLPGRGWVGEPNPPSRGGPTSGHSALTPTPSYHPYVTPRRLPTLSVSELPHETSGNLWSDKWTAPGESLDHSHSHSQASVQGYLAHEKAPTPLGPPQDPRPRPMVGALRGGGGSRE